MPNLSPDVPHGNSEPKQDELESLELSHQRGEDPIMIDPKLGTPFEPLFEADGLKLVRAMNRALPQSLPPKC